MRRVWRSRSEASGSEPESSQTRALGLRFNKVTEAGDKTVRPATMWARSGSAARRLRSAALASAGAVPRKRRPRGGAAAE